ncbi:hypothetical protein [Streptomyces sp. NPDC096013]|uniref:hypothetical protein n=1 Tax=Streptomyces sp. NPDC096013 TaxID=3366069 RepID=UPI0038043A25
MGMSPRRESAGRRRCVAPRRTVHLPCAARLSARPVVADPGLPVQAGLRCEPPAAQAGDWRGDANSTDGSEPSIDHTKGQINCDAGYEFWLAELP